MADGVPITAGSGTTILTDDTGATGHAQIVKLGVSADGSATLLPADGTEGLLVNLGANNDVLIGDGGGSITVDDGGLTLSVDGTVTADAGTGFAPVVTDGSAAGTTGTHVLGTDGTNAQILSTNTSGHVNIADGGNAITVDGTVSVDLNAGTNNIGDVDVLTVPIPLSTTGGGTEATALRVTLANDSTGVVSIDDNNGSITVDGTFWQATQPVSGTVTANAGTGPWPVTDNAGSLTVDQATASNLNAQVVGPAAQDAAVSGNPLLNGARASTAQPTAMSADGDAVHLWANRRGAVVTAQAPHTALNGSPWTLASASAQYSTTQTSTQLVAASAGQQIVVTSYQIQATGTTAGAVQLYFGSAAFSRGTTPAVFDGSFAPSATFYPGALQSGTWIGAAATPLRVTTSAAINTLTITVWYYIVS